MQLKIAPEDAIKEILDLIDNGVFIIQYLKVPNGAKEILEECAKEFGHEDLEFNKKRFGINLFEPKTSSLVLRLREDWVSKSSQALSRIFDDKFAMMEFSEAVHSLTIQEEEDLQILINTNIDSGIKVLKSHYKFVSARIGFESIKTKSEKTKDIKDLIKEGSQLCHEIHAYQIAYQGFANLEKGGTTPKGKPGDFLAEKNKLVSEDASNWFLDVIEFLKKEDVESIECVEFQDAYHSHTSEHAKTKDPYETATLLYKEIEKSNKVLIDYSKASASRSLAKVPNSAKLGENTNDQKTGVFDGIVFVKGACYGKVLSPEQEFRLKKIFELSENKPAFYNDVFNEDMKDNTVYQFVNRTNERLFRGKKVLYKDASRVYWSA